MDPLFIVLDTLSNHNIIYRHFDLQLVKDEELNLLFTGTRLIDLPYQHITPVYLELNTAVFRSKNTLIDFPEVSVLQDRRGLLLACLCKTTTNTICEHQAAVLIALIATDQYRVFFDSHYRKPLLIKAAVEYGLENEADLDSFFRLEYQDQKLSIIARQASILPVSVESLTSLKKQILPKAAEIRVEAQESMVIVLRQHKYYKHLVTELYKAALTKEGKLKNPLVEMSPLDFIWEENDALVLKFFTAINKFQGAVQSEDTDADFAALRAILKNPLLLQFYFHDYSKGEKISASTIVPIDISQSTANLKLVIGQKNQFYELSGSINIDDISYRLSDVSIMFSRFIHAGGKFYLIQNEELTGIIGLFKKRAENLLIHESGFKKFKTELLLPLEDKFLIAYNHIQQATAEQLNSYGFNSEPEKIIYLSDFGHFVMIIPVCRYGEIEIPIRTKRQIFEQDLNGKDFFVKRNEEAEINFTALIIRQHEFFNEQLHNQLDYFYLHKQRFLDENWFLNVFEEWADQHITVLGFNDLEGNRLSGEKISVSIKVLSGINWFNAHVKVRFGKRKAALKQVQKAIKNKSKYVQLDDGTLGILPADWVDRFKAWFRSAEIADDESLRIPKVNFSAIDDLFGEEAIDDKIREEISMYLHLSADFKKTDAVQVPPEFKGVLRKYQQEGLNWLNFLDTYNFGGCLADDMGLGKTVQIIAFILLQRSKVFQNTNLLIVPTSLIMNWQAELLKFAPSVSVHTIYGAGRKKNILEFDKYEVILTSYGTLLTDVTFLKEYSYNYIFLDESQNIKNPDSQRNRAVRSLKSRNRIILTGTPVENFTTDIYGQFSFTCPGLLGSRQAFKDLYSIPIDRFKNSRKLNELKEKIRPFILRRTKNEVAPELPEKTEMVLYCEMKEEQQSIYDAAEKELRDYVSAITNEEIRKTPMSVLRGLTRLRQICDSPRLLKNDALNSAASAKTDMLIEEIEGKMGQHKILVFSQFVTMLDLIRNELIARNIKHSYLTGASKNRGAIVEQFQTSADIRVFLISLKAGGTGLNLTEADYVYLVDPWWNPAVENQAIDRAHRIGQDKKIVAVRLICPGTVEEKILKLQTTKKSLAENLIQTQPSVTGSLDREELLGLFN